MFFVFQVVFLTKVRNYNRCGKHARFFVPACAHSSRKDTPISVRQGSDRFLQSVPNKKGPVSAVKHIFFLKKSIKKSAFLQC